MFLKKTQLNLLLKKFIEIKNVMQTTSKSSASVPGGYR